MTIRYFESFDTMARISVGLDGGGDQDGSFAWANGTNQRHDYAEGPDGPGDQCIQVFEAMRYPFASGISKVGLTDYTRIVCGAWFKFTTGGGLLDPYIFSIGAGATENPTNMIILRSNVNGDIWLTQNNTVISSTISGVVSTTGWVHLGIDIDQPNGVVQVYQDGVRVFNITGLTIPAFDGTCNIYTGKQPVELQTMRRFINMSDFYVSNEPWDSTMPDVMAVQIAATQDRYESSSLSGFKSTMIFNGTRYESDALIANIESDTYDAGANVATKTNFMYATTPTGEEWSEYQLGLINQWGLCCWPDGSGHTVRLANMCLEVLRWNNGKPKVDCIMPGPAAYFSGPWVKSNPELAYYAHVNKKPRSNETEYANTTSLFIDTYGCMLFTPYFPPTEPEPLESIGITFAEERREDYTDWVDLLGEGNDYLSYFVSGYSLVGQGDKFFANNYLTINFRNVGNGAAYAQGVWDWSNSAESSRWGMRQKVYGPARTVGGFYTHGARKLMMRGQGRSLQVRISSETGKPFEIAGWTMYITGNSKA